MRIFSVIILILALAACAKPVAPPPYTIASKELSKNNYEIRLVGRKGISLKQLKGFMQVKADELCDKAFVLRDNREESYPEGGGDASSEIDHYALKVEIECVTGEWSR